VLSEELVSLDKFYCPYGTEVDIQMHHRSKRGFWEGLEFQLSTPSVDWRKKVGTKALGAGLSRQVLLYKNVQIYILEAISKVF
jgi:hypothetical protein